MSAPLSVNANSVSLNRASTSVERVLFFKTAVETSLFVAEKTPKIDRSRAMPAGYRQGIVDLLREMGSVQN